jgi:ParB family chromosome partitioning protein
MNINPIALDRLSVSKLNMRAGKKPPDISDILPSIISRGLIMPLIVRPKAVPENAEEGADTLYEIMAGKRRYYASLEAAKQRDDPPCLPCIILAEGDDADALEISMIENMLRQAPDPVTQWESYTRLVKEGRSVEAIAATFALTELQVKRILALGNLLPRIREAYRAGEIDGETVKHLTLATKAQQKAWLALLEGQDSHAPRGHQLKTWLFGGGAISTSVALFDLDGYDGLVIKNLFEEDAYFADADQFWAAQSTEIEARKAAYLSDGWSDVVIIPPHNHFSTWEYEKAPKRKGGRVYINVSSRGEVSFHEGYVTTKEGQRMRRTKAEGKDGAALPKVVRGELTSTLTSYVDLHRHAAVRAELAAHPGVALRVMVAHAICGSPLWRVEVQSQRSRNAAVDESVETCVAETCFDERRSAVLACLGFDRDEPTVTLGHEPMNGITGLFTRLLDLPDSVVMEVLAIVMAETLASGTSLIEVLGTHLSVNMADYWQADSAFFALLHDREVATLILAEVGGSTVAQANAGQKLKTIKSVISDHLSGENGRAKAQAWIPRWMAFPPSTYTTRGGVATVKAAKRVKWMAEESTEPGLKADPIATGMGEGEGACDSDDGVTTDTNTAEASIDEEVERLAA